MSRQPCADVVNIIIRGVPAKRSRPVGRPSRKGSEMKIGDIEVEDGMLADIASEFVSDAEAIEAQIKRGGYGYDGGEEMLIDHTADLCRLRITAAVLSDYTALRERVKRLERAIEQARPELRCCANQLAAKGMVVHPKGSVQRAIDAMNAALAEPDPTPLRTCLESIRAIEAEAWRLNRAGDNEALRAMAGRLQQVREGL